MPPRKRAKPLAPATEEDELSTREASRLRALSEGHLLSRAAPHPTATRVPPALRKADACDIVKRNASRKKKYLFLFPGFVSLPPGARIGNLSGLDTRNPTLRVDLPPHGSLRFRGSLVFPRNAFVALKGPTSRAKPVHVVDTFETLVVFAEWAWVGDQRNNPGALPEPLPAVIRRPGVEVPDVWKAPGKAKPKAHVVVHEDASAPATKPREDDTFVVDDVAESPSVGAGEESVDIEDEDDIIELDEESDDGSDAWERRLSQSVGNGVLPRSNPRRKRKRINYALEDDEDEVEEDADDDDHVKMDNGDNHVKKNVGQYQRDNDDDDDPGFELGPELDDPAENTAMF